MRTIWRIVAKTVFWSYERGTWPYDVAVALIVVFVLFSPRSWFNDRPSSASVTSTAVQLHHADQAHGIEVYRVDARAVADVGQPVEPELEYKLHEAVRRSVRRLEQHQFQIVGIDAVLGDGGAITYYDVSITR